MENTNRKSDPMKIYKAVETALVNINSAQYEVNDPGGTKAETNRILKEASTILAQVKADITAYVNLPLQSQALYTTPDDLHQSICRRHSQRSYRLYCVQHRRSAQRTTQTREKTQCLRTRLAQSARRLYQASEESSDGFLRSARQCNVCDYRPRILPTPGKTRSIRSHLRTRAVILRYHHFVGELSSDLGPRLYLVQWLPSITHQRIPPTPITLRTIIFRNLNFTSS